MEAIPATNKETKKQHVASGLNLSLLEEKVSLLVDTIKKLKSENQQLKDQNQSLQEQLKAVEGSLVLETKGVEELSQEKMMTKLVVDDLLKSIDELIDQKEK